MDLFAHFPKYPDVDYCITSGATFNQNYNETLDSGTIRIDHILNSKELTLKKIKPFDDVIVYSGSIRKKTHLLESIQGENFRDSVTGNFYAHFIVGDINRQVITAPNSKKTYNFTISLISETKGLERIPLPNISITQPRNGRIITIGSIISDLINQFSPRIKMCLEQDSANSSWSLEKKYYVNPTDDCWDGLWDYECPERTFNNPTLRSVLNFVVSAKDKIIVVHDWVIKCIDITERKNYLGDFESKANNGIANSVMSSSDYCDRLRTEYSDGLAQKTTTHYSEKLGFRNSDAAVMTLQNMRLEFSHPIYRIDKLLMCYYKNVASKVDGTPDTLNPKYVLVKRDITKLVILNEKRDLLSENWHDVYIMQNHIPTSIDDVAKYRLCTVGYDIGSKYITDWGKVYTFPTGFTKGTRSYLENIVSIVSAVEFLNDAKITTEYIKPTEEDAVDVAFHEVDRMAYDGMSQFPSQAAAIKDAMDTFFTELRTEFKVSEVPEFDTFLPTAFSLKLKSIFFECEYEGFIDGAVIASKDYHDGSVVSIDAQEQSLAIVEDDGIAKKEKVNRLGNETLIVPKRHLSIDDIHNLGDYDIDDNIIYQSAITVFNDYIAAVYYLCKDYVLKNYYTGVISKHRPFALTNYSESVKRKENRTIEVLISSNSSYSHDDNQKMPFHVESGNGEDMSDYGISSVLLSFFNESSFNYNTHVFSTDGAVNYSTISTSQEDHILTDTQVFNFGYAMCINVSMEYNLKTKAYISRFTPDFWQSFKEKITSFFGALNNSEDYLDMITGSLQSYSMLERNEYEQTMNIEFSAFSIPQNTINLFFHDDNKNPADPLYPNIQPDGFSIEYADEPMDEYLLKYPNISQEFLSNANFRFVSKINKKDQKESVSVTMQYEPISEDDDIQFSPYFLLLSDIYKQYPKVINEITYSEVNQIAIANGTRLIGQRLTEFSPVSIKAKPIVLFGFMDSINNSEFEFDLSENPIEVVWDRQIMGPSTNTPINTDPSKNFHKIVCLITSFSKTSDSDGGILTVGFVVRAYLDFEGVQYARFSGTITNRSVLDGGDYDIDTQTSDGGSGDTTTERKKYVIADGYTTFVFNLYDLFLSSGGYPDREYSDFSDYDFVDGYSGGYWYWYFPCLTYGLKDHASSDWFKRGAMHIKDIPQSISSTEPITIPRNLFACLCPPMGKNTKYEKLSVIPNDYFQLPKNSSNGFSIDSNENGVYILAREQPYVIVGQQYSIRCYYYDSADSLYHFVYGQNFTATSPTNNSVKAYISYMDTREKTVYKTDGDAYGRIANCAPDGDGVPYGQPTAIKVY